MPGMRTHGRLPSDAIIHTREPVNPETTDAETDVPSFEKLGLDELKEQIGNVARHLENRSFVVDEYNSAAVSGAGSSASVTVPPTYEYKPEKIESIIVTGPTGVINLQLGDRQWALTIPASGILVIAPIAILLSRSDARILTPVTPGVYTLELMGVADQRFST